jgi:hypothetical protein
VHTIKKSLSRAIVIIILVGGFILASDVHVDTVKAATDVTGIISSDVTWTKANSPYSLTGPMLVNNGVTLTIEPGVTVYFNEHDLKVNGTLVARGSSTDKIHLEISDTPFYYYGGEIEFTSSSVDWNEETGSGCIIENVVVNTRLSISNSPKISNNVINARISVDGASPVTISDNTITGYIAVSSESSVVISNNNIVLEAVYSSPIVITGGSAVISNNNITGNGTVGTIGIDFEGENGVYISDNIISGFKIYGIRAAGKSTIERNLIFGNNYGIEIGKGIMFTDMYFGATSNIIIRNNTIEDNSYGIYGPTYATTIIYNNIQNNSDYNVGLRGGGNITVTYNWWGTTNTQAINQTMFDFKNDYNLGTITFIPFLTEPIPEKVSTPIPEFPSWIILPLVTTTTLLILIYKKRLPTKHQNQKKSFILGD